jgi:serine phosphatase RsbU (regulator of sigma subunit)/uncharacterized membrane protein
MESLKQILLRNRQTLIVILSAVLILSAVIDIYYVLEVRVLSNDECVWAPIKTTSGSAILEFKLVKVKGVTWNAGIRDGDKLLKINNKSFKDEYEAQSILNKVKSGNYAKYTVQKKDGRIVNTEVYIKKLVSIRDLASSLLAFFWIVIGSIVLLAKPDGFVQKLFYAIGAANVILLSRIIFPINITPELVSSNYLLYLTFGYLYLLYLCFGPFLVIYFFWIFPKPFKFLEKKWVKIVLFLIPSLIFVFSFIFLILYFAFYNRNFSFIRQILDSLMYLLLAANLIAYISLIINYRRIKTKEERKPIFIILIAFTLGIAASIYTATIAPAITDVIYNNPEYYTPIILIVLVPLAFAYSIFRYQLLDVSVVIKNTITYGAAMVSIAGIYFFVIYLIGQSVSEAIGTEYQGIIAGLVFIVFAMVFQSTKDRFQDFITARFYPEQFAYQRVLLKFSNEVSSMVGLENILDTMKRTFVEALKIEKFGILLKEKNDDSFSLERNFGIGKEKINLRNNGLEKFIQDKTALSKEPVIERDDFINLFPGEYSKLINENIYTIIPMVIKSKPVGLILFGLKHSGSQFAGKDIELLNATANQAAISIENARLYQTEAEKQKIERDLDLARKIQQSLLPQSIPNIPGLDIYGEMIPAMQVGGDYFDFIPVSDKKLFVVVGDVSGKGLAASLYMTKLQTMIQLACTIDKTPKEILVEINKKFYESIERNWFVTMTVALFDVENKTVQFCRAGHMPVLTKTNNHMECYRTKGLGVGMEKGIIFEKTLDQQTLQLSSGQIFAFFSDGITEAMNENLDLFGEEKLISIIMRNSQKKSTELMKDIWGSISSFRQKAEQNDDMTMVLVKVN